MGASCITTEGQNDGLSEGDADGIVEGSPVNLPFIPEIVSTSQIFDSVIYFQSNPQ